MNCVRSIPLWVLLFSGLFVSPSFSQYQMLIPYDPEGNETIIVAGHEALIQAGALVRHTMRLYEGGPEFEYLQYEGFPSKRTPKKLQELREAMEEHSSNAVGGFATNPETGRILLVVDPHFWPREFLPATAIHEYVEGHAAIHAEATLAEIVANRRAGIFEAYVEWCLLNAPSKWESIRRAGDRLSQRWINEQNSLIEKPEAGTRGEPADPEIRHALVTEFLGLRSDSPDAWRELWKAEVQPEIDAVAERTEAVLQKIAELAENVNEISRKDIRELIASNPELFLRAEAREVQDVWFRLRYRFRAAGLPEKWLDALVKLGFLHSTPGADGENFYGRSPEVWGYHPKARRQARLAAGDVGDRRSSRRPQKTKEAHRPSDHPVDTDGTLGREGRAPSPREARKRSTDNRDPRI